MGLILSLRLLPLLPLAAAMTCQAPVVGLRPEEGLTDSSNQDGPGSQAATAPVELGSEPGKAGAVVVLRSELAAYPAGDPRVQVGQAVRLAQRALDAEQFAEALEILESYGDSPPIAKDTIRWLRSRALGGLGRNAEAEALVAEFAPTSRLFVEAGLLRAEWALDKGNHQAALRALSAISTASAPAGGPASLRASLLRCKAHEAAGQDSEAHGACLEFWRQESRDTPDAGEAVAALRRLESARPQELARGFEDAVARSEALASVHANQAVVDLLAPYESELDQLWARDPETACRGLFQWGRALHKLRRYSESFPRLRQGAGTCPNPEVAVKAQYLLAQGLSRSGRPDDAVAAYVSLSDRFPEHSYADDGLYQAAQTLRLDGRLKESRDHLRQMADRFPEGDMVGPGIWGMAWNAWEENQPAEALSWLDILAQGNVDGPRRSWVLKARYWQARALVAADPERVSSALTAWEDLARGHPQHYYGLLSLWRLGLYAPTRARSIQSEVQALRSSTTDRARGPSRFLVDRKLWEHSSLQRALEWIRAGLGQEATPWVLEALNRDDEEDWDEGSLVFAAQLLLQAGSPYHSHNLLRRSYRRVHPPYTPAQQTSYRLAFPLAFHPQIAQATQEFDWNPLVFQGLVREESAFQPEVVSWAGAIGLSQLMWPTAKEVWGRMGRKGLQRDLLNDPRTNIEVGTYFFNTLMGRWKGHLPLAIASYNAGGGAVSKWVKARGELELDAWVETIPYDQTRHYVKRVLGSYQTYWLLYGTGPAFAPLRLGPVRAAIDGEDPRL